LKHNYVYKLIADNYESVLILEDYVILCDNFLEKISYYNFQLPKYYDMLFIGDGCNLYIENNYFIHNQNIYEKCLYPTSGGG
jgi:GR25 family glycosyltransferase involved in LPS biosynthesis